MQQITRGDYLKDLITINVRNNLEQDLSELYDKFIFQCGSIQLFLEPASVIKISFNEQESQLLKGTNVCYLAGITKDGHKETFNGSLAFNTRGEVVYYEPPVSTIIPESTESTFSGCFSNGFQSAVTAYFYLNYAPSKLSQLQNDTDFQTGAQVAESISIHDASTDAHPYIQDLISTEASLRNSQTEVLNIKIDNEISIRAGETEALHGSIQAETTAREQAISLAISTTEGYTDTTVSVHNSSTDAHPYIQSVLTSTTEAIDIKIGDLDNLDTSNKSSIVNAINSEVTARENADNNLQGQIDGLAAASDVTDIVGTYQELQNYDTQHLNDNDIIKVLSDETHDDQPSYYRYDKETDTFSYIGSESAAYTKAQSDSLFVTQTTEINGHALSSDINLTASDIGALPDDTVIGNGAVIFQKNGTAFNTATANQTNTVTVNYSIPTQASDINALPSSTTITDLADTTQMAAINSGITSTIVAQVGTNTTNIASNTSVLAQHTTAIASNTSAISTINGKIPTDASSSNKLVSAASLAASIADFANKDLNNLTSNGEARLHALKAYADEGELLTDPDGLSFVKNYAHSTFDRSKFTVVGSPSITDDGIASKWGKIGYLNTSVNLSSYNSWKISFDDIIIKSKGVAADWAQFVGGNAIKICKVTSQNEIRCNVYDSNGTAILQPALSVINTTDIDDVISITLEFTGTQYELTVNNKTRGEIKNAYANSSTKVKSDVLQFLTTTDQQNSNDLVDLKKVTVTADGIEVFNGNRTGIDTIKPDNYTVVGTPTISADGIASGFSGSDYLTTLTFNPSTKAWTIINSFTTGASVTGSNQHFLGNSANSVSAKIDTNGHPIVYLSSNGTSNDIGTITGTYTFLANTKYYVKIDFTGSKYILSYSLDGKTYTETGTAITSSTAVYASATLRLGRGTASAYPFGGSIDLNAFKVYVNGDLIYQPCLKIPYTESKTGSKIVQSVYRDRVNDMAEQFGYANYYTLDEDNGNFTLPQVELYGLIGQRTLRDSYRNGINYWELYSNRDLEQGGSCTSGVEVTFARPFTDTNYVLSVPYSAKSATAFTPTQTGDWIAKGKGLL